VALLLPSDQRQAHKGYMGFLRVRITGCRALMSRSSQLLALPSEPSHDDASSGLLESGRTRGCVHR